MYRRGGVLDRKREDEKRGRPDSKETKGYRRDIPRIYSPVKCRGSGIP